MSNSTLQPGQHAVDLLATIRHRAPELAAVYAARDSWKRLEKLLP